MFEIADTESRSRGGEASAIALAPVARDDRRAHARLRRRLWLAITAGAAELPAPELGGRIVFTHGFGIEGQVILHWICEQELDIDLVTLDTGRLFPETYELWADTERRYGRRIRAIYPDRRRSKNWSRATVSTAFISRRKRGSPAATPAKSGRSSARSPAPKPGSPARAPTRTPCAAPPA